MNDPIIDEIHRYRRQMAEESGYDLNVFFENVRKRQALQPQQIKTVRLKPRKPQIPESQAAVSSN